MGRHRLVRAIKVCKICGEGFDAFKARDARGRYCSPACLIEARRRQREGIPVEDLDAAQDALAGPPIGPAMLPQVISLGSRKAVVSLGPDPAAPPGDPPRHLV